MIDRAARLPVVQKKAKNKKSEKGNISRGLPFSVDRYSGTAEKIEGRLATDHGKHNIVGKKIFFSVCVLQEHGIASDLFDLRPQRQMDGARRMFASHAGECRGRYAFG